MRLLGELFERQVNAGDATRASLTYKKLARHGSPTWQQKFRFGQLLEGSNKKLAVGTYEAALRRSGEAGQEEGCGAVLERIVALEPTQANFLRVAELSSELGNRKVAAAAFQRVAQLAAAEGGDTAQWYERAYQEDSSDQGIALAYGKSLLAQGQVGAAIFILEPQVNAGEVSPELRDIYAEALMAAGRFAEAEPLVWQLFEENPARVQQVIGADRTVCWTSSRTMRRLRWRASWSNSSGGAASGGSSSPSCRTLRRRIASSPQMLEFLSELYNASNRENRLLPDAAEVVRSLLQHRRICQGGGMPGPRGGSGSV